MSPAMENPLAISTLTAVMQEARRTEPLIQSTRDNDSTSNLRGMLQVTARSHWARSA
jgi:hypothetical protein